MRDRAWVQALSHPALVKMQFQVAAITSGYKAQDYFRRFPGRFISAHLQDYAPEDHKKEVERDDSLVLRVGHERRSIFRKVDATDRTPHGFRAIAEHYPRRLLGRSNGATDRNALSALSERNTTGVYGVDGVSEQDPERKFTETTPGPQVLIL